MAKFTINRIRSNNGEIKYEVRRKISGGMLLVACMTSRKAAQQLIKEMREDDRNAR